MIVCTWNVVYYSIQSTTESHQKTIFEEFNTNNEQNNKYEKVDDPHKASAVVMNNLTKTNATRPQHFFKLFYR